MNTSFKVYGKKGNNGSSIKHIERDHSLKKNPTKSSSEKSNIGTPHIIIYRKCKPKIITPPPQVTHTQISRKIQTYKTRLKKHLKELEKIEDLKKRETKLKTIERQRKKIQELEDQKESTTRLRKGKEVDYVDIPFSITECPPESLTIEDFEKLSQISEQVVLHMFDIPKDEIGLVAHLDQSSSHVHAFFNVPDGKNLSDIKKVESYREGQLLFNKLVREEFPHLEINKICDIPGQNKYLPLKDYKQKCELLKAEKQKNDLKLHIDELETEKTTLKTHINSLEAQKNISESNSSSKVENAEYEQLQVKYDKTKKIADTAKGIVKNIVDGLGVPKVGNTITDQGIIEFVKQTIDDLKQKLKEKDEQIEVQQEAITYLNNRIETSQPHPETTIKTPEKDIVIETTDPDDESTSPIGYK